MKDTLGIKTILDAVSKNNTVSVIKILEDLGFDGQKNVIISSKEAKTVSFLLSAASTSAWRYTLDNELAKAIIHRTAPLVSPSLFLELIQQISRKDDYDGIDFELIDVFYGEKEPTKNDVDKIGLLNMDALRSLIAFIAEDENVEKITSEIWEAIIYAIDKREIVSRDMLLAYMACSLKEPVFGKEESPKKLIEDVLDAIFG